MSDICKAKFFGKIESGYALIFNDSSRTPGSQDTGTQLLFTMPGGHPGNVGPTTGRRFNRGLMSLQTSNPSSHRCLSYADSIAAMWQDFLLLVGRIMLGWIFFQSGWGKIGNIAGYAKSFPRRGLAEWMAYISVPAEFLGGLFLILGFATRYTVLVMLFFTVVASFSSHAYWSVPEAQRASQASSFWKNISIMGGLIVLFVSAAGRFSLDNLLFRKQR